MKNVTYCQQLLVFVGLAFGLTGIAKTINEVQDWVLDSRDKTQMWDFVEEKDSLFPVEIKDERSLYMVDDHKVLDFPEDHVRYVIAFTIWCEARSNRFELKLVASVIDNRSRNRHMDYLDVVHSARQFSCWGEDGFSPIDQRVHPRDLEMWEKAERIATNMVTGTFRPVTTATHFYAQRRIDPPRWADELIVTEVTDSHTYMRYASK